MICKRTLNFACLFTGSGTPRGGGRGGRGGGRGRFITLYLSRISK